MQRFDERLNLVLEQTRHQPFTALVIDLVQGKQRHFNRHAIFRIPRFMQVTHAAIHAA